MTWAEFRDKQSYRLVNGEIFINVNRRLRRFIRANRYPDQTKTFGYNRAGYAQAFKWLTGGDPPC